MTVAELGQRMDADELGWWAALEALEWDEQQKGGLAGMVERELVKAAEE